MVPDNPDEKCEISHITGNIYIVLGGSCVYNTNVMITPLLYHSPRTYLTSENELMFAASSFKLTLLSNITEKDLEFFQTSAESVTFTCYSDSGNTIIVSANNGFAILRTSYFYKINEKFAYISEPSVEKRFFK